MATTQDYSSLFKEVYGNGPVNLLPAANKVQKMFPFAKGEMVGNEFVENLDVEFEHGFTFAAQDVAPSLAGAVAAENVQAKIQPFQMIGQKIVGYRDITRTDGAGKKAFTSAVTKRITDLMRGTRRNIEISLMHGQSPDGIGVVKGVVGQVITLTSATTAPGIWAGSRNMVLNVFASDYSTTHATNLTVSAINPTDLDNFAITVVGNVGSIIAGDIIYRNTGLLSGGTYKECFGLKYILKNTSTALFNVDPSLHNLWAANSFPVGGRLTMKAILAACDLGVSKGLDGDVVCFIPTRAYAPLNDDQSAFRVFDESYNDKMAENGFSTIAFWGQTGKILIVPHLYMMQGEAWIIPYTDEGDAEDRPVKRIGSTDVTFGMPGAQGGTESNDIFLQVAGTAAVEIRNFTDQQIFIAKPGWCTILTGITY